MSTTNPTDLSGQYLPQEDPAQEARRLRQAYAHMSDQELFQLDAQPLDLTPVARQTLQDEMALRNLDQAANPFTAGRVEVAEYAPVVTIRRFSEALEGQMAHGLLESFGIYSVLTGSESFPLGASVPVESSVRLQVRPEDVSAAVQILETPPATDVPTSVPETGA